MAHRLQGELQIVLLRCFYAVDWYGVRCHMDLQNQYGDSKTPRYGPTLVSNSVFQNIWVYHSLSTGIWTRLLGYGAPQWKS